MKKNMKRVIFLLIVFVGGFIFQNNVKAFTIGYNGVVSGTFPNIRRYYADINGGTYMAYCLDPGRPAFYSSSSITSLNPTHYPVGTAMYKFALASQYLYQSMLEGGLTSANDLGYAVGNTAFRLIARTYYDGGNQGTPELNRAYNAYNGFGAGLSRTNGIQEGINFAGAAVQFAEANGNTEYADLVSSGAIHGISWTATSSEIKPVDGTTNYQLTVEVQPSSSQIYSIDYSRFTVTFLNTTAKIVSQSATQANGNGAKITVIFDGSAWNQQDLAAYVDAYYCDPNSGSSMLYLLNTRAGRQRFVVVLPGNANSCGSSANPYGGGRFRIPGIGSNELCTCDTNTGIYSYKKYSDGNLVIDKSWKSGEKAPEEVDFSKCPATCDKDDKHICQKPSENAENKWYCEDHNGDGKGDECNEEQYNKECKMSCLKPEESKDGKWHDKDGNVTDENGYNKDCLCPTLPPDSPEYKQKCLNCSPSVDVPSSCNEVDVETTTGGTISDINRIKSECNPDINQVKYCVLDKKDAAGEEFLAPNEIDNNPYCKVYCEEQYHFELPTAMFSNSGRYIGYKKNDLNNVFLQTTITGERNCYTSGAEDPMQPIGYNRNGENQFLKDYEAAQKAVIDAWNEYNHWKVAASIPATEKENSCTHSPHSYSCGDDKTCHCGGCSATGKVVTKNWEFVQYDYSGNSRMESDSYSDGEPAQCTHNTCTGKIGINPDAEHREKRDAARKVLVSAVEHLNQIVSLYNSCTGIIGNTNYSSNLTTVNPSSTASSSWDNAMVFDPQVKFKYDESYLNNSEWEFKRVNDDGNGTPEYMYCDGNITDEYGCIGNEKKSTDPNNYFASPTTVVTCDEDSCRSTTFTLSTTKWIRKTRTHIGTYQSDKVFSTSTPYGTIQPDKKGDNNLWSTLPEHSFPVELQTGTGVYNYSFQFSKIGQHNQNNQLGEGRLIGESNSVLNAYNKLDPSTTCRKDNSFTGSYVCHYIVNCPDCDFECDPDDPNHCELDGCPGGYCTFDCPNCVFDGKTANYTYRTVSLNNLFPNAERAVGFNWNEAINAKAQRTQEEIDGLGEEIYNTPQYSFLLTANDMKNIRAYNDEAGSYVNNRTPKSINGDDEAVYCETVTINGIEYPVRCKSRFLDMLEQRKGYGTVLERITSSTDRFELYSCPEGDNSCFGNGIGPAWKIRSES